MVNHHRGGRHTLLAALLLLACIACTARDPRVPAADGLSPLPEVRELTFTGNTHFSSRTLRKQMVTQPRPLLPPWKRGEPYNPPTVQEDLRRLKKFYFDRGFLDTTVRLGNVQHDPERQTVRLEIVIDEGPATLVSAVHLAGTVPAALPPTQELLQRLPLRPGERINKADFDNSVRLLRTLLHNASYARARIVPETEVDPQAHTAAVTFTLHPGDPTVFGPVTIEGEQLVYERAIRRQRTFEPGQPYSAKAIDTSAEAIYGLGMFQAVTPRMLNFEAAEAPLEMEFEVRERKPRTIRVGVGVSSVERVRFQIEWLHRNLFKGAERLTLNAKVSSIEQGFEARLHLPYILRRRLTFTQTFFVRNEAEINTDPLGLFDALFNFEEAQPAFDLFSLGGETRLGYQFTPTLSGAAGLALSRNDFSNVDLEALEEDVSEEIAQDNLLFIQFVEANWDTTDNLLNPTRGLRLRGRLEHSNTALLSDVSFAKLLLEFRHYHPLWWQIILATRLKLGTIYPYGASDTVPFNVRFFAGGPGSVRGFALNRLGPVDNEDNPIGGLSLIEGSIELRLPIFGALSGALFIDFGNVYADEFTYRLGDLRYAVGPGVRYNTPIGPVRIDVGFIVDRRSGEDFGRVEFSIGQAF
jgi:outer membrane protein assembly complex protein YaeT